MSEAMRGILAGLREAEEMDRKLAIAIARKCAKAKPQSYYSEPFEPHEWVIDAIMEALLQTPSETQEQVRCVNCSMIRSVAQIRCNCGFYHCVPVNAPSGPSKTSATKLDSIVAQVPHKRHTSSSSKSFVNLTVDWRKIAQRHRTGVKPSRPGTYVQFSYACNKDCPRCQLEAYAAEEKQRREKLEALCAKMDRLAKYAHNTDCGVAAEKLKEFADELRSALLEEE